MAVPILELRSGSCGLIVEAHSIASAPATMPCRAVHPKT